MSAMSSRPKRPIPSRKQSATANLNPLALDTPERIVEYCRSKGLINGVSTDIEGLIRETPGLQLDFESLDGYDAYIECTGDNTYRIVVNKDHPKTRQRFSMAHEYVHFQMHRPEITSMPKGERILHRDEQRNPVEYFANSVAAEILMPKDVFLELAKEKRGMIPEIATAFEVSSLAVRYRARDLGIGGHGL